MTDRELLQQALEILEDTPTKNGVLRHRKAIEAIRARLVQPEQGLPNFANITTPEAYRRGFAAASAIAAPHMPAQKPLTDEQVINIAGNVADIGLAIRIARAIEAAHGIKG